MNGSELSQPIAASLGSREELERRLSLATPKDMVRGLAFHTVEEALRADLGEEAVRHCLRDCTEKHFRSFFLYPVADYLPLLYEAAWMLSERHGGFEPAVRRIAMGIAPGFISSMVGKAFMMMTREGPRRLIDYIPTAFRSTATFGDPEVHWVGPTHGVLTTRRDFLLYLNHEGGLMSLFQMLKLRGVRVQGRQTGPLENEVEFSWE
jgi:uncharacterized protein (TIGR02265 family)